VLYGVGLYWSLSWLLAMLDREYDEEEVVDVYERRRVGPRHATHFDTEGLDDDTASLRLLGQPDGEGEPPSEGREDRRVVPGERVEPDLVDAKTRRWIVRQAIPPKVSPDGKRRTYASASDETWAEVVTDFRRERDRTWLQRALADHDSPAGRILAAAAVKRAARLAEDGPAPVPAT
jgi:hypothetical protein